MRARSRAMPMSPRIWWQYTLVEALRFRTLFLVGDVRRAGSKNHSDQPHKNRRAVAGAGCLQVMPLSTQSRCQREPKAECRDIARRAGDPGGGSARGGCWLVSWKD